MSIEMTMPDEPARPVERSPEPISSPDVGDHCAAGLGADELTEFFSQSIGPLGGADYQRALRLPDDRVLWTFQDAFVGDALIHNVGVIQSGRCFTLLPHGDQSWLFDDSTLPRRRWHWILGGGLSSDAARVHLFVVEMRETGSSYLSRTRPVALRRVVLDASTLTIVDSVDEPKTGDDLYGWAVTSDATYTYLYSHCYQQFGFDGLLGFGSCVADVKLARVPLGEFDATREYWDGQGWTTNHEVAAPVVDGTFVFSGNNPAQIRSGGNRFLLVEKRDDWFGDTVEFGVADDPQGPFTHVASIAQPLRCPAAVCNSYFATWLPWSGPDGDPIWSISHNRWDGSATQTHLEDYRPTFATVQLDG